MQRTSYGERLLEERRAAEEEERIAVEQDAFEREVLELRRDWAELKLEYELRRLRLKALHPPSDDPSRQSDGDPSHHSNRQPRVPAGSPDGGVFQDADLLLQALRGLAISSPAQSQDTPEMKKEPRHRGLGDSMSDWIAFTPGSLNDLPLGMWQIVSVAFTH